MCGRSLEACSDTDKRRFHSSTSWRGPVTLKTEEGRGGQRPPSAAAPDGLGCGRGRQLSCCHQIRFEDTTLPSRTQSISWGERERSGRVHRSTRGRPCPSRHGGACGAGPLPGDGAPAVAVRAQPLHPQEPLWSRFERRQLLCPLLCQEARTDQSGPTGALSPCVSQLPVPRRPGGVREPREPAGTREG